ncbi:unnamed protein product [Spirodela intermedia]|uniref:Late embryogenesis abundant protein LEA-2 subgroup domain-containing protein n=1 Tax=Spirodela intermedia TaxID=51605 RepID=A0A7I8L3D8_SPIIN|nr:unnamed protein product [Spirodela intermedia]
MNSEPKPVVTGYPAAAQPSYSGTAAAGPAYGSSYPYPATAPAYYPPPPPPPPGPYHDPNAVYGHRNSSSLFIRRLIIICISVFLIIAIVTFILWLVLRFRLPEVAVSAASVSSFNVSNSQQVTGNFNLTFMVRNRNQKMGIFYDRVQAAVFYGSDSISETSLPPFYQGKGNSTAVPARFAAVSAYVDPDVASSILKERSNGGVVNFHVRIMAWVRFRAGAWRTRRHVMRVYCDNVRIGFSNSTSLIGSLEGAPKTCRVDV